MPYVEGFGTWPFGEEWLWEAMAGCYLPLLDVLDARCAADAVADARALRPARGSRASRSASALRRGRALANPRARRGRAARGRHEQPGARARARVAATTSARWSACSARGGDLLGALAAARPLDLLGDARDPAAAGHRRRAALQVAQRHRLTPPALRGLARAASGCRSAPMRPWLRARWPRRACAAICVELTDASGRAPGSTCARSRSESRPGARADRPRHDGAGVERRRLPGAGAYRDYHRLTTITTTPGTTPARPTTTRPRWRSRARDAADFVGRVRARLREAARGGSGGLPGGGLVVCALDTELLGHWWYEGVAWLAAVVEECGRQGLELVRSTTRSLALT